MVGIYLKMNDVNNSIVDECKELAKETYELFIDEGRNRESKKTLFEKIVNKKIETVITYDFQTISRKKEELIEFIEILKDNDVNLLIAKSCELDSKDKMDSILNLLNNMI